ncbi:MAG: hypothetical protein DRI86_09670 [Bacteroidetes bacterium]|nr:MAG: hypothetical protein DRI86_09670 [Bacteroidota bacterium]
MKRIAIITIVLLFAFNSDIKAQNYDFGFVRNSSLVVKDSLGNSLSMPWVGGLNSVHMQQLDLNLDGVLDLLVFEIHGNKLHTFINDNIADSASYTYAPEYVKLLPSISSWIQTVDYDRDGDLDIFTYIPGGIRVYLNESIGSQLIFTQKVNMINYLSIGGYYINIYVSSVDYPAIVDVDYDGDYDIVTFDILGGYLIHYRNYATELNLPNDSLEFKIGNHCWGNFFEGENSNSVLLNHSCLNPPSVQPALPKGEMKHAGSTVLIMDMNGDSLKDLLLGDVDFFTITNLTNGGTLDSANMISQDTVFPIYDTSISMVSFPVVNHIDIDNNGVKEFIISPFEAAYYKPEAQNSVLLYDNIGEENSPILKYKMNNFLQNRMIDVGDDAAPTLVDVDGDGLQDIILGNYGRIESTYFDTLWYILQTKKVSELTYYRNIGTSDLAEFQLMDKNWIGMDILDRQALKPTFGDLDGDGDMDMLLGSNTGTIVYKENIAGAGQTMVFDTTNHRNYQNIDVGEFSAPQLIDIDGDNLLDLVIGHRRGTIHYYHNTGSANNPVFTYVTDSMGQINTSTYWHYNNGYSVPNFFYDNADSLRAMVGSASGFIFYYRNIRGNEVGTFGMDSNLYYADWADTLYSVMSFTNEGAIWEPFTTGFRSCPLIYDFDGDTLLDMMVGSFSGGLNYFKGTAGPSIGFDEMVFNSPEVRAYPNPTDDIFTINISDIMKIKNIELTVFDVAGRIVYSRKYNPRNNISIDVRDLYSGMYFVKLDFVSRSGKKDSKVVKLMKI